MQKFIGGIGCFRDETEYQGVPGIISTECGYCGGKNPKVTYEQVCGGDTEHIEVVKVTFDPKIISYEDVTRLFFKIFLMIFFRFTIIFFFSDNCNYFTIKFFINLI